MIAGRAKEHDQSTQDDQQQHKETDHDRQQAAIDRHLEVCGIPVSYTNVFWGGRSEIKPSEISPFAYADWCRKMGIDPDTMRG